jgi:hypothetical protein
MSDVFHVQPVYHHNSEHVRRKVYNNVHLYKFVQKQIVSLELRCLEFVHRRWTSPLPRKSADFTICAVWISTQQKLFWIRCLLYFNTHYTL